MLRDDDDDDTFFCGGVGVLCVTRDYRRELFSFEKKKRETKAHSFRDSIEFDALFESSEGKRSYIKKSVCCWCCISLSFSRKRERERERKKEKGKREGFLRSTKKETERKKETRGRARRVKKRESDRAMSYGGNATPSAGKSTTEKSSTATTTTTTKASASGGAPPPPARIPPPKYVTPSPPLRASDGKETMIKTATTTTKHIDGVMHDGGAINAEDFVKQRQKEQQIQQQNRQQQQAKVFGSQATQKPAFGKSPTPRPPQPVAATAASTGQKKANVWTRPVASTAAPPAPGGGARTSPNGVTAAVQSRPPPVSNGNNTSNNHNINTGSTANTKPSVATQATQTTQTTVTKRQQQAGGSNVNKETTASAAKQQQQQQKKKEKAQSPIVEAAKFPKHPQPRTGMATTKETPASSVGRSTSTTATGTTVIPTQSFAMRRASPPRDAIYTENESLLTSPGPSDMQNNTNNAKKSSNILTTKTAVDVKENAAAQLVPAPAVVAKEYRGKIACPACAKDFDGSPKLRAHVVKCRTTHVGGTKLSLLSDDNINAYVAQKHREALQLGKDAAQQRKKDAAAAERTTSKAMTEATDDDSDSEEPKMFHHSKKQQNEKGHIKGRVGGDNGDEKNNAALSKEKSTLQGIEETLLGDSESDDRDFAMHAADVALRKKKLSSKQRDSSVRVTPDDALAERLLRDDVNFTPAATNLTRRDSARGSGAKNANKMDDFESDDEQRASIRTQKVTKKSNDKVPEALRCTRTNGVWRCSKEKVSGALFCEKHLQKIADVNTRKEKSGLRKRMIGDKGANEPEKEDLLTEDEDDEGKETVAPLVLNKKDTSARGQNPHLLVSSDAVKKPVSLAGKALDCPHCGKHFSKNTPGRSSHIRSCEKKTRNANRKIRNIVSPPRVQNAKMDKKVESAVVPAPLAPPSLPSNATSNAFTCVKCGKVCGGRGQLTMHERACKAVSSTAAPPVVASQKRERSPETKKRGRPPKVPRANEVIPAPKPTILYKNNANKPEWMCVAAGGSWCCNEAKVSGTKFCERHQRKSRAKKAPAAKQAKTSLQMKTSPRVQMKTSTPVQIHPHSRSCGYCGMKYEESKDLMEHLKTKHGFDEVMVCIKPIEGATKMPKHVPNDNQGVPSSSPSPLPESSPARIAVKKSAPALSQEMPSSKVVAHKTKQVSELMFTCEKCGKVIRTKGPYMSHVKRCQGTRVALNANESAPATTKVEAAVGAIETRRQQRINYNTLHSSGPKVSLPTLPRKDVAVVNTERNERSSSLALTTPNNKSSGGVVAAAAAATEANSMAELLEIVNTQNARIQQQDIAIKKLADQCMLMSQNIKTGWLPPFDPTAQIKRVKAPGANPGYNPIIQFGRLLWLTGIVSRELSNDAGEQTLSALQNMKFMLTQAGTDLKHLLRVTLHVSDIRVMEKTATAWKEFFIKRNGMKEEDLPVRLTTQSVLKDPKFLVEVHAEAVLPEKNGDMKSVVDGAKALGNA